MRRRRWDRAALVLASAGPFAVGLGFEHVYDDRYTLVSSPALGLPLPGLVRALVRGDGAFPDASRPAMVLSAYLDRALFGSSPLGTHLTSLALYVASTFAAAALAFAVLRRRRAALGAAVIWAVMPVHAEAVVCASYREDLFATVGVLGALAIVLAPTAEPHTWRRATAFGALFALGLAGKESALVLVPLLALLAPPLGQAGSGARATLAAWAARRERSLVLGALVLATYLAWRAGVWIEGDGIARAARAGGAPELARYVVWAAGRSLWPVEAMPIHPVLSPASWLWWLPLAAAVAAVAAARGAPAGRAGMLLLAGALLTSPVIGPANERADRYLLVTTLGSACLVSLALDAAAARLGTRWRRAYPVGVAIVALALGAWSLLAAQVWSSDLALFGHATAQVPESAKAWQGLASAQRRADLLDDAERSLARSLALDPERPETRLSSAYLALARGDVERARRTLEALRDEGHGELRGMRRARRCAFDVPMAEAPACVREGAR